ncbi:MAG: 1-(5-phosphoribosyl)-5-[(5-phosphoribosylamino)methylideneamino]imidazole-4-carboxamide isomerase [Flavobacteriaceae bacterium]|nr:1-(5-phosphoribosyl)-5-[(5-phosphoribosylamino)methylideneamino]imidazole-4-carboxamide isomerase [Flavobacteriaceae bacterium]
MILVPAIDIINGQCVRLTKGNYDTKKVYNESPVEVAKSFEGAGLTHVHVVDLDGARAKHIVNIKVLEAIATKTSLTIDFGGGIKSAVDLKTAFDCGATQVILGSIAVNSPKLVLEWLQNFGADKLILGADTKNRRIATHGWEKDSGINILDFIKDYSAKGFKHVLCTDVAKDGMLAGPSLELYYELLEEIKKISLIASGGVSSMDDLYQLEELGCTAAIVGKAIYEGKISLKELENYQLEQS